jgi:hypothetical protein
VSEGMSCYKLAEIKENTKGMTKEIDEWKTVYN